MTKEKNEKGFDGCGKETVNACEGITIGASSHNMIYLSNL